MPMMPETVPQTRNTTETTIGSVRIADASAGWVRRFMGFVGPGYMIAVGYMDPGNWATDLQGGAAFGQTLLCVIVLSNLMAMLLQALSARLGIVTGRDLAQSCRDRLPHGVNIVLWLACEIAIIACDLAEVVGTAIALQLLFGLPLLWGAALSVCDAVLVLGLMRRGFRYLEAFVIALMTIIAGAFAIQLVAAKPPLADLAQGLLPHPGILTNPAMLYVAISIIGATVMPHNLYLHSSIVQSRAYPRTDAGRSEALRWASWDSTLALGFALLVNAAILIVAACAFHTTGHQDVSDIAVAYHLLSPLLGLSAASALFGIALLAAGTNSTVTGTLAGQIIMSGFLDLRLPDWARRLLTRGLAILPVLAVLAFWGEHGVGKLLIASQVVLSLQLPFAVVPLIWFVSDRKAMGRFTIGRHTKTAAWATAALIIVLNIKLLADTFFA